MKVRQALQHGINRKEILDTVYTPDWKLATSFIQSNVPGATDHSDLLAYDPGKAEKLLDEAGWTKGADGIRTKDGKPLTLTLYPNPYLATSKSIDELIAQQLGKIGWKVDIRAYDVVTFGEKVKFGGPAVPAYEVTRSFIDAGTVASILTDANNGENWFALGDSDKKLNDLRDKIASAGSAELRDPLLDELQNYVLEQGYFIPRTQIVQRHLPAVPEAQRRGLQRHRLRELLHGLDQRVARSATEQFVEASGMSKAYLPYAAKRLAQARRRHPAGLRLHLRRRQHPAGRPDHQRLRNPQNGFTEDEIKEIIAAHGLDQPILVQLWKSLSRFVTGDLGLSMRSNRPVTTLIAEVLPSTLILASAGFAVALLLAIAIAFGTQFLPKRSARACCAASRRCSCRCRTS